MEPTQLLGPAVAPLNYGVAPPADAPPVYAPLASVIPPVLDGGYLKPKIEGDWRLKPAFMGIVALLRDYSSENTRLLQFMDDRRDLITLADIHLAAAKQNHKDLSKKIPLDSVLQRFLEESSVPLPKGWSSWSGEYNKENFETVEKVLQGIYASESREKAAAARASVEGSIAGLDAQAQELDSSTLNFVEENGVAAPPELSGWQSSYSEDGLKKIKQALTDWSPGVLSEDKKKMLALLDKQLAEFSKQLILSETEYETLGKLVLAKPEKWASWVKKEGYTRAELEEGIQTLTDWMTPLDQQANKRSSLKIMKEALAKFPEKMELDPAVRSFLQKNSVPLPAGLLPWVRRYIRSELSSIYSAIESWTTPSASDTVASEKVAALADLKKQIDNYPDSADIDKAVVQDFCQEYIGWHDGWDKDKYPRSELLELRDLLQKFEEIPRGEGERYSKILAGQKSTLPAGITGGKVSMNPDAIEFFKKHLAKPEWRSSGNWNNPYTEQDFDGLARQLDGFILSQSDFATDAQLKVQKALQRYNNGVALLNSLQNAIAELVKTLIQALR